MPRSLRKGGHVGVMMVKFIRGLMSANNMDKIRLLRILLVISIVLTIVAAMNLIYLHQKPVRERQTIILGSYAHKATYDCVAELKPNIIYNKTMLRPNEGTLYIALVTRINISFTYVFSPNSEMVDVKIDEMVVELESPGKWVKLLRDSEAREFIEVRGSVNFTLIMDCAVMRQLVDRIDKEVGTYTQSYNVYVRPTLRVKALINSRMIEDVYVPTLTIMFRVGTEKGSFISMDGLSQVHTKNITEVREILYPEVDVQRSISYGWSIAMTAILATSAVAYFRNLKQAKPEESRTRGVKKMSREYKDIIVEAEAGSPETSMTINVKTLEDLVRVAEILAKPILKTMKNGDQVFYVVDGNIKYQYEVRD